MTTEEVGLEQRILDHLKQRFPDAVKDSRVQRPGRAWVTVDKARFHEVAQFLKEEWGFDHAKSVAGVDYDREKKVEVVYLAASYSRPELYRLILHLRTELARDDPRMPTLTDVWSSVHFHEREAFEMFGVQFEGHPDLRKLLTLDNWEGPPPMRKDIRIPELGSG